MAIDEERYEIPPERAEKFVWQPGEVQVLGQCVGCVHKHLGANTCDAFPRGIPEPITWGEFDHRNEYPGDQGVRYEPKEGVNPDAWRLIPVSR